MLDLPPRKEIIEPKQGWHENSYYAVEASFSANNPMHRYIFYTGFLNGKGGGPGAYNMFMDFTNVEERLTISDVYYLRPLSCFGYDKLIKGFTLLHKPIFEKEIT
jgi:hypothetical protein